jgi:hypothetical protein
MAAALYYIAWNSVALSSATAKTILEFPSPANVSMQIEELVIGCDASTAGNLKVEWGTYTTTGTGTAATPQKWQGDRNIDSAVASAKVADTVEPSGFSQGTLGGTLYPAVVIPLPMYFPFQWPLEHEFAVPESTNFAIRLTASIAANTMGWIRWRE